MIDRRALLIALHRHGVLTSENQYRFRMDDERTVRHALVAMSAPAEILKLAGLPPYRRRHGAPLSRFTIQRHVDGHLRQLGMPAVDVTLVDPRWAESRSYDKTWMDLLLAGEIPYDSLPYQHLPQRVVQILCHYDDPAWEPLIYLAEHGIHPYGLVLTRDSFLVVAA